MENAAASSSQNTEMPPKYSEKASLHKRKLTILSYRIVSAYLTHITHISPITSAKINLIIGRHYSRTYIIFKSMQFFCETVERK